jgi:hypothetical protein
LWSGGLAPAVAHEERQRRGWATFGESRMKVGYVVLYVNDTEACRRFWVEQIGMVEKRRDEAGGVTFVRVGFADQPFAFELVPLELMKDNPDNQRDSLSWKWLRGDPTLIGNFGTLGRNIVRLNGEKNFDWSVYKNTCITERVKLQVRAEFYNIFNNHAFQDVNRNISNAAFGQYTTVANNARNMQVGARVIF